MAVVGLRLDTSVNFIAQTQIHAVFLCHGLWGRPEHMHTLRRVLQQRADSTGHILEVHCCESYSDVKTYDGVDVCADRVVEEIHSKIEDYRKASQEVRKFSILGYSLGGLIARLAVYILDKQGFFERIHPCNFTTVASPALGVPITPGAVSSVMGAVSSFFLSRTGEQLYLKDKYSKSGKPLVEELASQEYLATLNKFEKIDVYANAVLDRVVPYLTGGIDDSDPFLPALAKSGVFRAPAEQSVVIGDIELTLDPKYPGLISGVKNRPVPTREPKGSWEKPAFWISIKPWFSPSTYPFLPKPLDIGLVILIPTIIPPIILILASFTFHRIASFLRIRKHFRSNPSAADSERKSHPHFDLESQKTKVTKEQSNDSNQLSTLVSDAGTIAMDMVSSPTSDLEVGLDISGLHTGGSRPALHDPQKSMALAIKAGLPKMKKHIAFFPGVFTSHKMIICQDERITEHKRGLDVINHCVDH
ncbi:putative serine esterase-domain-containing protein, partial [Cantharellus anzutake]|uniref:putative serine esterase-domain-containing protein n=1 Tax=Cantharellus anzutake TaxID=1750568 RepID=UPI00190424D8